jgi:hypothetical protein
MSIVIDRQSNEIDMKNWEILGKLPYKKNVSVLYLRNRWRRPDEEQIFLVGYQKDKEGK